MIDQYLDDFSRWISGSRSKKQRLRAELETHLRAAEQAGDLEGALRRLGPPRDAARSFAGGEAPAPAPLTRRIPAFLIDVAMTVAVVFAGLGLGSTDSAPLQVLGGVLVTLGVLWWPVGLTLAEWRYRRTPGKALMGLEVVSEDGTAPGFGQVVVRRLTLVFSGPLQVIDWVFALFNDERQRAVERLARTMVVPVEPEPAPATAATTSSALAP
jgi:uncharacterized RDD family membrane protein YckC